MKRVISLTLCVLLLVSCFSGCAVVNFSDWNIQTVTGTGDLESYEIKVDEYHRIRVSGFCNVRYYASSSDTVTLEIQPNLRDYIEVASNGSVLVIETKRGYSINTSKTPVLTVYTPVLNRLDISGAGSFTAYDTIIGDSFSVNLSGAGSGKAELAVDSLSIQISGAGSFDLSGRADSADFEMSGAGSLSALSLNTREAKVRLAGAGTVKVHCSGNLRIDASGVGTIEYSGSPSVDLSKSGMVTVRQVN